MEPLFEKLKQEGITTPQRLVLPESTEERNMKAAEMMLAEGTGKIILIGNKEEILAKAKELNLPHIGNATFVDNNDKEVVGKICPTLLRASQKQRHYTGASASHRQRPPLFRMLARESRRC